MTLTKDEKSPAKGTLRSSFGHLKSSVAYEIETPPVAEAASKK